jgi:hypothetical protein
VITHGLIEIRARSCKEYRQDGEVVAMDFTAARNMITIRSKAPARREMTEEEKMAAAERLAEIRSRKSL